MGRNAHQRAPVLGRPGDIGRRFESGDQPLVGVHQRIGDGAETGSVLEHPGNVAASDVAQLILPVRIEERILSITTKELVDVHARTVDPEDRLRHEGRMKAVPVCNRAYHQLEGRHIVRGSQSIGQCKVNLVLAGSNLVVRAFHFETHGFEDIDHVAASFLTAIHGSQVEVSAGVVGRRRRRSGFVLQEQEELRFKAGEHLEAFRQSLAQRAFETGSWTAFEFPAIRLANITDQTGDLAALDLFERKDPESSEVRLQQHVRLLDPREPLDRGAIEQDPSLQSPLELPFRDLNVLGHPHDVDELQSHEPDAFFAACFEHLCFGHGSPLPGGLPAPATASGRFDRHHVARRQSQHILAAQPLLLPLAQLQRIDALLSTPSPRQTVGRMLPPLG